MAFRETDERMNGYLRQSTASQSRLIGPFVDDTDFKTAKTALTIANTDIKLRANGTTLSNKNSGGGTHQVNGMYSLTWDATDTANVGELFFSVVVAGALPVFGSYVVLEEVVYDALFAASAPGYVADQPVNATKIGSTTQTGRDIGASVLLSSGTGTGQLDFASGVVKSNLSQILGTALTETAGQIAAAFKKFFDKASPTGTVNSLPDAVPDAAGGLPVTGTRLTAIPTLPAALVGGRIDASIGAYQSGQAPLQPTIAGRTLDVSAGGEAGIDWANIGSPTTTVGLSGTTVKTATDVETDTQDIQSRLPAALDGNGFIKADVEDWKAATAPAMTGDAYARLGAPAGASVSADVAAVKTDTVAIKAKTDNLPTSPAATGDIPTTTEITNAVLDESLDSHNTSGTVGGTLSRNSVVTGFRQESGSMVRFYGGEIDPSYLGESVVVVSSLTINYDNQYQGMLFVIDDTNFPASIKFVATILFSDQGDNSFTLSKPLPSVTATDPIPFLILPAGMGDATRALILYEGN